MMNMIDRIMKAFVRQHPSLTAEQETKVREEVTEFAQSMLTDYKIALAQQHELIVSRDKTDMRRSN